ncbi:MAG: HPr kinase/phosphatase C-terminal domain-containing protein [Hyphomicrobiales bacterium]
MNSDSQIVHATCVALNGRGVLIRGVSGSGKSALALSLIDVPGRGLGEELLVGQLVADDHTRLWRAGEQLLAAPPQTLAGLMEVRGLGILSVSCLAQAPVTLVVNLVPPQEIERLPEPSTLSTLLLGLSVPRIKVAERNPMAASLVRAALTAKPASTRGD